MALCVIVKNSGVVEQSTTETIDNCTSYVLPTAQDYTDLKNTSLVSLFNEYFGFDPQLFEYIVGATIVAYILGHSVGAIVKLMRST